MSGLKPALYYAIRTGSLYNPVVAVTTEKGHRWHGRAWVNSPRSAEGGYWEGTHGSMSDLSGRFETKAAAEAMREQIASLANAFDEQRKKLQNIVSTLYKLERESMARLIAGNLPLDPPVVMNVQHGQAGELEKSIDPFTGGVIFIKPLPWRIQDGD